MNGLPPPSKSPYSTTLALTADFPNLLIISFGSLQAKLNSGRCPMSQGTYNGHAGYVSSQSTNKSCLLQRDTGSPTEVIPAA